MGFEPCVGLGSGVRTAGHAGCLWECAGALDKDEGRLQCLLSLW